MATTYGVNLNNITSASQTGVVLDQLGLYLDAGIPASYLKYGSTWKDLSSYGRHVTLYSLGGTTYSANTALAPTYSISRLGQFDFDGVNDWGKFNTNFTLSGTHTVSVWVKTTSTGGALGILSHCSGGPVNSMYNISSGKMRYTYYVSAWQNSLGTPSVNDGTWKNLVWAKTGTSLKMYVDGTLTDTITLVGTIVENIGCIGSGLGPCNSISYGAGTDSYGQVFSGSIGAMMIHHKELSLSEIQQNYNYLKNRFKV